MGLLEVANAFEDLSGVKFLISGKNYSDINFENFSNTEYLGVIERSELLEYMEQSIAFINPQDPDFTENQDNFPSKLYEYINTLKPVISTKTDGLSPEIRDILVMLDSLDKNEIVEKIEFVISNYEAVASETAKNRKSLLKIIHGKQKPESL